MLYSFFFPWFIREKNSAPKFSKSDCLLSFFIEIKEIFFFELISKTKIFFFRSLVFNKSCMKENSLVEINFFK